MNIIFLFIILCNNWFSRLQRYCKKKNAQTKIYQKKSTLIYTLRPNSLIINTNKISTLFYTLRVRLWVIWLKVALQRPSIVFTEEFLVCLTLHPVDASIISIKGKGHHTLTDAQHRHQTDADLLFRHALK